MVKYDHISHGMCGLINKKEQSITSNRVFAREQRTFNEDILSWICRRYGMLIWRFASVPVEDVDELRDKQLLSARLDNAQKALQIGLDVEWTDGKLEISGTPQLQESVNEPLSLPDVPATAGEITTKSQYTYNYGTAEKACPPGEHEHPDFPYCHPADREHRTEGGSEGDDKPSSENQAEEAQISIEDAETVEELEEAVKAELQALIPDLQIDLKNGDPAACKQVMRQFCDLTKLYKTPCRSIDISIFGRMAIAGTSKDKTRISLNTPYFIANPSSNRSAAQKITETLADCRSTKYHAPMRDGEEVAYSLSHEFGHTLSSPEFMSDVEDMWQEYSKKYPKSSVSEDPDFISTYASDSKEEFVAEAFASVMHCDNPSSIAKEIVEKINQHSRRK